MFFVERVIAVIENQKYRDAVEKLGVRLRAQGLEFLCPDMNNCSGLLSDESEKNSLRKSVENTPVLWLTDNASCATVLRKKGHAVLAYLHADNRNQDFSAAGYACEEPQELDAEYMDRVFRRYMRLPWDILQTKRCFVRETVPEDAEAFYEIYGEPSVTRYMEGLSPDAEQEKQYINDYIDKIYSFYDCGIWTIIKDDTDEIIGRAGLTFREGYEDPEIGFVIGVPWQGQGYAEEVCRAILEYGRTELGFTTVQAFVRPENQASLSLCKKLGFETVGEVMLEKAVHRRLVRRL